MIFLAPYRIAHKKGNKGNKGYKPGLEATMRSKLQVGGRREPVKKTVLTDHEVLLLVELRTEGFSMMWLAQKFEVSKTCVARILDGRRRSDVTGIRPRAHREW